MIDLYSVSPGDTVHFKDGRVGECSENMGDGQWLEVSLNDSGEVELVHGQDIKAVEPK